MARDYIPNRDSDFNDFFKNIAQYVTSKCVGSASEWTHIPAADRIALDDAYIAWYNAYVLTLKPCTKQVRDEKNAQRTIAKKALRHFVNRFLRYEPVTNLDRSLMGIPNPDTIRTPLLDVDKMVAFKAKAGEVRELELKLWVDGEKSRGKPDGYPAALVIYAIMDKAPENIEDLMQHFALATKSKHTLKFRESERGKVVYIAMAWFNRRGVMGSWSAIQPAIVP